MNALIVVWRESLEAMLVVGVLLAWISRQATPAPLRHRLWWSVAGGVVLAVLLAVATFLIRSQLQGQVLETFQIFMVLAAAALIVQMVRWMRHHGRSMRQELERRADGATGAMGVGLVAALAVAREGAETVVFLYGIGLESSGRTAPGTAAAVGAGFLLAVSTAWLIARGARHLSYRSVLRTSEILLLLIAGGLLGHGVDRLITMDWLPPLQDPVWDTSAWLGDSDGLGRLMADFIGYRSRPCTTLLAAYGLYWTAVSMALRQKAPRSPAAQAA